MRVLAAVGVAILVLVAMASPAAATPAGTTDRTAAPPADPPTDRLGWEGGYWYNESIAVTPEDGLNETELDRVVNRSMARVEHIRQLEFNRTVPVSLISRETYRERYVNGSNRTVPESLRTFDNVKFEALFLINETTDSIGVQQQNRGVAVGGFYSYDRDRIVVVSENATAPRISEITLAQELFHALQDQHFNLSRYDQSTRERHNAIDGIVEGDGNLVDYLYAQRCRAEWECLRDTGNASGGGDGGLANIGTYLLKFQPYSDGPKFVQQIRREGGWEAVNAVYANPPASTEQVIHPERYPNDTPTNVTLVDRTNGSWERVRPPGRPDYGEVGEAGITTMLVYPTYDSEGRTQVVPIREWLNRTADGDLSSIDPLNYANRYATGWDGDKLAVYQNDANETGYVWRLVWDDSGEATEFLEGYLRVLDYWGAERVAPRTYVIGEGGFADAFHLRVQNETVTVVNAPTVGELDDVRTNVTVTDGPSVTDPGTGEEPVGTTTAGSVPTLPADGPSVVPAQPGFGAVFAVVALAWLVVLSARRR